MEDYYTHRNQGHRYLIKKIDDSEDIQLVDADGMADEQHTKLMRVYPHGFSSHSVDEAHMLALSLGGRRDLLVALGGEHHQKRPKNLPKGDTVLYNAEGDVIRLFGKKTLDITHAKNIKLSIGKGLKDSSGGGQNSGSNGPSQGGKEAEAGEDKDVTIVITEKDITLTKGKTTVKLTGDSLLCEGASDAAYGVKGGRYVRVRPNRVDLGVTSPTGEAPCKVATECGLSEIVFARID